MSHAAETRALLTRAAELEAKRQQAAARGDVQTVVAIERELRDLWKRYANLDAS
jgi:hypothetical protein